MSARSRSPINVVMSIESSSLRASSAESTGVLPRMTTFWGDESWKQAAYAESPQGRLFGREIVKQGNEEIVAAFRKRLREVAGFAFVPTPLPMRNSTNAVVYYLFLASQKICSRKNH